MWVQYSFISPFHNYSVSSDNRSISSSLSGNKIRHWNLNTQWPYCGHKTLEIGDDKMPEAILDETRQVSCKKASFCFAEFPKNTSTHFVGARDWSFNTNSSVVGLSLSWKLPLRYSDSGTLASTRSTLVKLKFFAFFRLTFLSRQLASFVAPSFSLRIFFHVLRFCFTPENLIFHDFQARALWTNAVNLLLLLPLLFDKLSFVLQL